MVAGEFSAGKTRLINGLLGHSVLPSNVTATALPAIWITHGTPACFAVDLEGVARPIATPADADLQQTQYCVLFHPAPVLEQFDIIDTPGTSDPNMPAQSWERMLEFADAIVWCSTATQAWRQSEKSVWVEMPERLLQRATLLITHADRMPDARSAERVLRRVRRDAQAYFDTFLMESLLDTTALNRIRTHLNAVMQDVSREIGGEGIGASDLGQVPQVDMPVAPPATPSVPASQITPRRIRPEGKPPVEAPTDLDGAGSHVAAHGPARVLWTEMSKDVDLTDVQSVLRSLERFIDTLDRNETDPVDALDPRLMSRKIL